MEKELAANSTQLAFIEKKDTLLRLEELQDEVDILRARLSKKSGKRRQVVATFGSIAAVCALAAAGPPILIILAMVFAGSAFVTHVGGMEDGKK